MSHINSTKERTHSHPKTRIVSIGEIPIHDNDKIQNLPDNRIVTSKYTLLTFIPKNLFEQFRRIANFYFLCVALIQSTTNSLVSPATSLVPLFFVVTTTAVKQAYEDWLRHQHDTAANRRKVTVRTDEGLMQYQCMDIRIGDIVMVENNEEFPCDLLMLSCNDTNGKCYITTANLDGETNLKDRSCVPITKMFTDSTDFNDFNAAIECDIPNTDLYEFKGVMRVYDADSSVSEFSLGPNNLLLRGARLRNSEFVYGVAVYTGQDTKMALNSKLTSNKFSSIEKTVNKYLLIYLFILLLMSIFCTIIRLSIRNHVEYKGWYLAGLPFQDDVLNISTIFQELLSFFVIFNYLIPISLYVTLEMVKFFGSKTLVSDKNLIDNSSHEKPICNTSDLNEELGQVEYLFSDKTGTLTENAMEFRACSINGELFQEKDDHLINIVTGHVQYASDYPEMETFWKCLALCNTVQVIVKEEIGDESDETVKSYEFYAPSPDEKALVEACHKFGLTLSDVSDASCTLMMGSTIEHYKILQTFDFNSNRKCMSVIVQNDNGEIFLMCKGSDSVMSDKCTRGKIKETMKHADTYGRNGLRILIVAMKTLTFYEYATIESELHDASLLIENRKEKMNAIQNCIENDLTILGATAVEDRLQEGVCETIADLKEAGIKIWVLTGDKLETAVSVGYLCSLLDSNTLQLTLERQRNLDSCEEMLNRYLTIVEDTPIHSEYAFIIDGRSMHMAMKYKEKFRKICENCSVVLCCRMSPIQKSELIRLIKESPSRPVTAAIGDGANDVSMLQEAHVGFGIMGREGRQAVNSSDFAFSKFRFVKRILLVHGHYFYRRVSVLIQYFFYKNVVFIAPQFLYSFFNGFSAQTVYHSMILMLYNTILTAGPIFVYALVERHIPSNVLSSFPQLYKNIRRNSNMTLLKFILWFCAGVWHGSVAFYGFILLTGSTHSFLSDGHSGGVFSFGILILHAVICIVTFKLLIISRKWNYRFISAGVFTLLLLPAFLSLYTNFKWGIIDDELYGLYNPFFISPSFWLSIFVIATFALLPDFTYIVISNTFSIKRFNKLLREKEKKNTRL